MPRFSDVETDPKRGRAFFSGGGNTDAIEIVTREGEHGGSIPLRHAEDMQLSPDGDTLYVVVRREPSRVAAIDLDTLEVSTVATLADDSGQLEAHRVAWAAGMLWVTVTGNSIVAVDPDTGQTHTFDLGFSVRSIAASPGRPNTLVVGQTIDLYRFQVTGGDEPSITVQQRRWLDSANIDQVVMSPDGSRIITASHAYHGAQVYRTSDLSPVDVYPVQTSTDAIAVRPDGQVAVGHGEISVYAAGHTSFAARHPVADWSPSGFGPRSRGLAWGAEELYAVVGNDHHTDIRVSVLPGDAPTSPPSRQRVQGPGFHQILPVPELGRAFLTQGRDGNGVFVLNRRGKITRVLEHLPGATGMTLSRDRSTLYVALHRADAIATVNTRTLRVRRISTGTDTCPFSVALTGRRLWFAGTCFLYGSGPLGAIDLWSGRVHHRVGNVAGNYLTTSAMRPGKMWVGVTGRPSSVLTLNVPSRGRPTAVRRAELGVGQQVSDLQVTPDGMHLLPATPSVPFHPVLDPATLEIVGAAETQFNPVGVAVRSDGLFAAGVADADLLGFLNKPVFGWTIRTFRTPLGRSLQARNRGLRLPSGDYIATRGIAFGRRDLYTVRAEDGERDLVVGMQQMPDVRPVTLTADRPGYRRGARALLVAHLSSVPKGAVVSVFRKTRAGRELIARGRPDRFANLRVRTRTRPGARYVAVLRSGGRTHTSRLRIAAPDPDSARARHTLEP